MTVFDWKDEGLNLGLCVCLVKLSHRWSPRAERILIITVLIYFTCLVWSLRVSSPPVLQLLKPEHTQYLFISANYCSPNRLQTFFLFLENFYSWEDTWKPKSTCSGRSPLASTKALLRIAARVCIIFNDDSSVFFYGLALLLQLSVCCYMFLLGCQKAPPLHLADEFCTCCVHS